MIDNTVALPPDRVRTNVRYGVEINGDSSEVETTLDACLQVQRWDRAFALLKQLVHIHRPGSPDLLPAYNRCLEAMVVDMLISKSRTNVDRINQWVEVDMADAGIKPDARTYALKIKVALATLVGSKRDRTVRRYWEKAKEQDAQFEVAGLRDVLTDSDLGKLNEICPINIDFELNLEDLPDVDVEVNATESIAQKQQAGVLETAQKGLGLSSLKKSLSLFSGNLHLSREDFQGTPEEVERQYAEARQSRLETDAIDSAIERWRVEHEKMTKMGIVSNLQHGKLGALLWQWHETFTQKLKKEMKLVEEAESKAKKNAKDRLRCEYGPFLRLMSPEHIAATTTIAAVQIMNKMGTAKTGTPVDFERMKDDVEQELGRFSFLDSHYDFATINSKTGILISGRYPARTTSESDVTTMQELAATVMERSSVILDSMLKANRTQRLPTLELGETYLDGSSWALLSRDKVNLSGAFINLSADQLNQLEGNPLYSKQLKGQTFVIVVRDVSGRYPKYLFETWDKSRIR